MSSFLLMLLLLNRFRRKLGEVEETFWLNFFQRSPSNFVKQYFQYSFSMKKMQGFPWRMRIKLSPIFCIQRSRVHKNLSLKCIIQFWAISGFWWVNFSYPLAMMQKFNFFCCSEDSIKLWSIKVWNLSFLDKLHLFNIFK